MAKHRPRSSLVMGLAQENRRIRQLQQEKQELQLALEEHQSALQLIMHKYRQHTARLLHANRLDATLAQRNVPSKVRVCLFRDIEEDGYLELTGEEEKSVSVSTHCSQLISDGNRKILRHDRTPLLHCSLQNGCVTHLVCWWAFGCSSPCAFNLHCWLASCSQHRERESRMSVFPCQYIAYPRQVLCSAFSWLQVSMGAARPQN